MKKYLVTLAKEEREALVTLAKEEREALGALTSKGEHKSQKILNALILLGCDEGEYQMKRSTNEEIACVLNISMRKIDRVKKRFVEEGIEVALNGKKGSRIYAKKVDGDFEAHLVAVSCSEPPEGFARWSLRLLADKVVELGYIDSISHEAVRQVLKKTKLSIGNEKDG
jgi:transposase